MKPVDSHIVVGAEPAKTGNPTAQARLVLAAIPRCGARARSTGAPCRQPGLGAGGRCRWHGGASTGAPIKSGRYSKIGKAYLEMLRILLHLLGDPPYAEDGGRGRWFYAPRDADDPAALVARYIKLRDGVRRLAKRTR
jgi:hypothetical protein